MQIQRDRMHLAANDNTRPFCTTNHPSPNSSLSAPIRQPSLHSSAPTNVSANQIDIRSSKRGYLCQRPQP
jgi:hypothetical protein